MCRLLLSGYICIVSLLRSINHIHMKITDICALTLAAILLSLSVNSYSQEISKEKDSITFFSIAPDDAQGYSSFIRMYPSSLYHEKANAILRKLNTSSTTDEQAMEAAIAAGYPRERIAAAKGIKELNKEHIFVILAPTPDSAIITIMLLNQENGYWKRGKKLVEPLYINDSQLETFTITCLEPVLVNGRQQILFKYTNTSQIIDERSKVPNSNCELVFNLYSIRNNNIYNMMYSGKAENGTLYGKSLDTILGDLKMATEQQRFLMDIIKNDKSLQPVDLKRFRNQEVIQWWYDYNPEINGGISFILLPNSAKFIEMFNTATSKIRTPGFSAAMFDNQYNNSVVVVQNRSTKKYSIAYCHTIPADASGCKLSGISLCEGNTIFLEFANNGNMMKYKLNLATKKLYK